jgi:hypothetical protein
MGHGTSTLYGMTAGHILQDWQKNTVYAYEHSIQPEHIEKIPLDDSIDAADSTMLQSAFQPKEDLSREAWNFSRCETLGDMLDTDQLPNVVAQISSPSHDWALFRVNSPKPNELRTLQNSGYYESRAILIASRPTFHDNLSDPVMVIGGSHEPKPGELSNLPGRILIGKNETFVDAYMLELNEGNGEDYVIDFPQNQQLTDYLSIIVCDGDSGAWVVHRASPEVYGHVVATDLFGDAYVIPLLDSFGNIKECIGAASIGLPRAEDFTAEVSDAEPLANSDLRSKQWNPIFSTGRKVVKEFKSYTDTLRSLGATGDDFSIFWRDDGKSVPSSAMEEVVEFCGGVVSGRLTSGTGTAGHRRVVWLDDRSRPSPTSIGGITRCRDLLTATELKDLLKQPVSKP